MFYQFDVANNNRFRLRVRKVFLVVIFIFTLLSGRLFYLQVIKGDEFRLLSKQNCIKFSKIYPTRGLIFDRNGKLLVNNELTFDLCVDIKTVSSVDGLIKKLASIICYNYDELITNFKVSRRSKFGNFVVLKKNISRETLAIVCANGYCLSGIKINVSSRRNYVYGSSLSHILGYVGEIGIDDLRKNVRLGYHVGDIVGKYGIEKINELDLRGTHGALWNQVNSSGEIVQTLGYISSIPGCDVFLTIDHDLQLFSESIFGDMKGGLVAINPINGEILTMVSRPSYNQNSFVSGITNLEWESMISNPLNSLMNKVTQGQYPPSSIYKIVTAIAGLEEKIINRETLSLCYGFYELGKRKYFCWNRDGHGDINVISALARSCDVFFYKLGCRLGIDCLAYYAEKLGFGASVSINLENEENGLVPTSDWKNLVYNVDWHPGEILSVAIGQSFNLVTPLQMVVMVSAIANGGKLHKPLLLKEIKNFSGFSVYKNHLDVLGFLSFDNDTIQSIREGLYQAVNNNNGTAYNIHTNDIQISGKTGTAQIIGREMANFFINEKLVNNVCFMDHAWFVGYAPINNPKIAIAVVVEHGGYGAKIAAPLASSVIKYYLAKLIE